MTAGTEETHYVTEELNRSLDNLLDVLIYLGLLHRGSANEA